MIDEFPINMEKFQAVASPTTKNIFKVDGSKIQNNSKVKLFHTAVAIGLFLCKRFRPYIQTTIVVLCTRVKHTNKVY